MKAKHFVSNDGVKSTLCKKTVLREFTIAVIARLSSEKGVDIAIRSMVNIVSIFPYTKMLIVGNGKQEEQLKTLAADMGLSRNIEFTGFVENVDKYIEACNVFLLPSRSEGFGFVLLEAMKHKKACIAFEDTAAREIIDHMGTGILLPRNENPEASISSAVRMLIEKPELSKALGINGYEKLCMRFTVSTSTDKLERVIKPEQQLKLPNLHIFMYHYVKRAPKSNDNKKLIKGLYVKPEHFSYQMHILEKYKINVMNTNELGNKEMKSPTVMITFDDGCSSIYKYAYPFLKKHNFSAIVFPIVELINKKEVNPGGTNQVKTNMLTESEIKEMHSNCIEIGSHMMNHVHLDSVNPENLNFEMKASKRILEEMTGSKVDLICYPFGSYNSFVLEKAESLGYKYGFTTKSEPNTLVKPLELRRVPVKGQSNRDMYKFLYMVNSKILRRNPISSCINSVIELFNFFISNS